MLTVGTEIEQLYAKDEKNVLTNGSEYERNRSERTRRDNWRTEQMLSKTKQIGLRKIMCLQSLKGNALDGSKMT